ncbi:dihydrofolate reductase/thymidilate synthase [Babesia bovis T2Bo]|uniref:Bifunctional dihydrofolate reductase-thymidylate synthase n=1 Tax=Babesia bovis TaxID=5865 RepID=A7ASX7_BABBO|nr:dihydrofolate reductase/thymidilate synthase [Babesia bovis T2Bo]3I3R_A Chain A, Dihydrofolate reductase/thymidylate synthase [Babesia bovis T2Bo]3I3R_B Chain B, Dihydrofolate reductase/thymidylate synthase [Babesia bovis T2Bo]3K2H_A Chain A, Dihydrofolate reductase/thymidylate synthase [Babesia bovis]3K2H_B Chain B, Dihydrofolate reductase/thymidylate synthase [Babesia bovis]3KJR_A Chain A, Dihydrofolate reductase/thymidylate synthase [Babesia bovis T2Bo]3KJR_B Chain B, Dihydrofolate redu|eukprot:XP_001609606.1 dihydrofolate reductase/thymidilate synthase [Babesia bovis T2Bo]
MSNSYEGCGDLTIFVAVALNKVIGHKNQIPWPHITHDFRFLRNGTTYIPPEVLSKNPDIQNVVIFGRKTYESIPKASLPLKNRINVILSRTVKEVPGCLVYEDLSTAIRDLRANVPHNKIFILGGSFLYKEVLDNGLCDKIYLTRLNKEYPGDTYFPDIPDTFEITAISPTFSTDFVSYDFVIYERKDCKTVFPDPPFDQLLMTGTDISVPKPKYVACPGVRIRNHEEFQYLDILADVLSHGVLKPNRTGTDAYSKFGYQMRFDLSRSFPLLTTKKVALRSIIEELLWFIKGSTNGNDLLAKNVRIWELNGRRDFLDKNGFTDREEHDLGPIYGFQWRHFGAEYLDMHADYTGKGIDQLAEIINRIKTNPNDRRLIVCSWNVSDLKKMALPPCHCFFQFYVSDNKLSCMMHQRSCDLGLGVPFNIASYSILTAMVAQVCGLGLGEFVHNLADAHIYVDHVDAVTTQIARIPHPFPRLRLNPDIRNIEDFTIDDIVVEDYVSHPPIPMAMSA